MEKKSIMKDVLEWRQYEIYVTKKAAIKARGDVKVKIIPCVITYL